MHAATAPSAPRHHRASTLKPTLIARAVCAALLGLPLLMGTGGSLAQSAVVETSRSYAVPAGPLAGALVNLAAQAGIQLSVDASLTAALHSPGVRGTHTVDAALAAALAGTGLEAIRRGDNEYTLRKLPPRAAGETTLAPVTVAATATNPAVTEDSASYTTPQMGTATKLALAMRETPQSVTVVTRQRMDDSAALTLSDVLRGTPGLNVSNADGPGRTSFGARGFALDNVMYDGLPSRYQGWVVGTVPNMAMYDRVEVVRGATGLVTGSGNPSAAVNVVRKRPTADTRLSLTARAGSWDNYQGEVDASGPLNAAGTLRGRVVGSLQEANTFRDGEEYRHGLFYGVVEADLGERTTLTLGASYQDDYTNHFWGGLPLTADGRHMNLPRSANPSNDWERKNQYLSTVFGDLVHRLDNGWTLRLAASQSWQDAVFLGTYIYRDATTDVLGHNAWRGDYDEDQATYDAYASGPFQLFGRQHELAFGTSRRQVDMRTQNYSGGGIISAGIDLWNWDNGSIAEPDFVPTTTSRNVTTQDGLYLTTRLNLADPLKLILGARLDWYDYDNRSGSGDYSVTRNLTRYGGIVYDLDHQHSLYASYTDIFQPQTNKGVDGKLLEPVQGENYELGIKGEYFGGSLNASAAVFQIEQSNRAKLLADQGPCPSYPGTSCYEASGLVRSKGVELEIQGALSPDWQVAAGYTYVSAEYVRDADQSNEGKNFATDSPHSVFKLSTLYRFGGALQAWRVGGSLYRQSRIYNDGTLPDGTAFRVQQKGYTLADLMVGYRVDKQLDLQLNVNNLFDRKYYKAVGYDTRWGSTDTYGDPRSFMLTARYSFF
ncbi:TonB-dependent receptor [Azoarcus sp. TTM-91]|uniref:TonB-dependent siderophore receptor n=1 Tax=Azoarcus sp. TTM-91 TaxID=2691581 RepID=UPI001B7CECEA|nr:TonB-dependent receptor [Azoarcus sp. TTM-91]